MTESIVYVVDDDPSVRKALARLLGTAGLEARCFADASELFDHEFEPEAHCLVLDLHMPGTGGLALQRRLRERGVELPIVFLTGHGDVPSSVRALKEGAVDFLTKPADDRELMSTVLGAIAAHVRGEERRSELDAFRARIARLTSREREVLELVVAGRLNKQIAMDLGIALDTVKSHRGRVMSKSGVDSVAELARLYERCGLGRGVAGDTDHAKVE
ncbi:MAG: response regulator [Planctomycetota bacterium]